MKRLLLLMLAMLLSMPVVFAKERGDKSSDDKKDSVVIGEETVVDCEKIQDSFQVIASHRKKKFSLNFDVSTLEGVGKGAN